MRRPRLALGLVSLLLAGLVAWHYYGADPHKVTKHARTEWSKRFREVGLAGVPRNAKYAGGAWTDGPWGYWNFRADVPTVQHWLSDSGALRTAEIKAKPGKQGYMVYARAANKVCLVVVETLGGQSAVMVKTVDLLTTSTDPNKQWRSRDNAQELLHQMLDEDPLWNSRNGPSALP